MNVAQAESINNKREKEIARRLQHEAEARCAIGPHTGFILSPLLRLVLTLARAGPANTYSYVMNTSL
eukprot:3507946-Pyramimonas_sp.AAC.1